MPRRTARDLTVGVVAALALAILAFTILAVGDESALFVAKTDFVVVLPSSEGLVIGSPVKMAGVQVGTVRGIRLPTEPGERGTAVTVGVETKYAGRVRADSRAALRILQYLSGERYVEIIPGSETEPALEAGSFVPLLEEQPLLEQGADIAQNLHDITAALSDILEPLRRGEGLLGEMIRNPDFGKEGLESLRGTLDNLSALTAQLRRGEGFVGRALHDEQFAGAIDDLTRGVAEFAELMVALNDEQSPLQELLQADGRGRQVIDDLAAAAASLRRTGERLESREGLLGRLLNDPDYSERMADDLQSTLGHLAEITRKIDEGEGTLGALLNDRVVYDGLEEVVAGVNDSKFARWLIRHYQKKGIKIETKEQKPD